MKIYFALQLSYSHLFDFRIDVKQGHENDSLFIYT